MATTIDGSNISFSGGGVALPLKTKMSSGINLSGLSWLQSTGGKYYTYVDVGLSSNNKIIAAFLGDGWSLMGVNMDIQPYISGNSNMLGIMADQGTFGNTKVDFWIIYI